MLCAHPPTPRPIVRRVRPTETPKNAENATARPRRPPPASAPRNSAKAIPKNNPKPIRASQRAKNGGLESASAPRSPNAVRKRPRHTLSSERREKQTVRMSRRCGKKSNPARTSRLGEKSNPAFERTPSVFSIFRNRRIWRYGQYICRMSMTRRRRGRTARTHRTSEKIFSVEKNPNSFFLFRPRTREKNPPRRSRPTAIRTGAIARPPPLDFVPHRPNRCADRPRAETRIAMRRASGRSAERAGRNRRAMPYLVPKPNKEHYILWLFLILDISNLCDFLTLHRHCVVIY